jgi:hypothetical protein
MSRDTAEGEKVTHVYPSPEIRDAYAGISSSLDAKAKEIELPAASRE